MPDSPQHLPETHVESLLELEDKLIEHQDEQPAPDSAAAANGEAGWQPALQGQGNGGRMPPPQEMLPPFDDVELAIENAALAAENRQLKQAAQGQKLGKLLGELRFLGKLTPGLEQAGVAEILAAAWDLEGRAPVPGRHSSEREEGNGAHGGAPSGPPTVTLPDGTELPLGQALENLLYAIPPSWGGDAWGGGVPVGPAAGRYPAASIDEYRRAAGPTLPPPLSSTERDVARTLGLTAEEYIGITAEG